MSQPGTFRFAFWLFSFHFSVDRKWKLWNVPPPLVAGCRFVQEKIAQIAGHGRRSGVGSWMPVPFLLHPEASDVYFLRVRHQPGNQLNTLDCKHNCRQASISFPLLYKWVAKLFSWCYIYNYCCCCYLAPKVTKHVSLKRIACFVENGCQWRILAWDLIHTGRATRRACKLERFSFDVACVQCEHSHWWQQVPFTCIALCITSHALCELGLKALQKQFAMPFLSGVCVSRNTEAQGVQGFLEIGVVFITKQENHSVFL